MKKILHLQLMPLLSGPQNVMLHILKALNPEEYDIYIASKPNGPLVGEVKARGYKYIALPFFKRSISVWDIVVFFQLIALFKKHRFDIVHTHASKPGLLGRIAAKIAHIPLIIHTGHGAPFHDYQSAIVRRFYMELERFGALFGDKLVFVNNSLKDFYLSHQMINKAKAVVIYNAIEPNLLSQIKAFALLRKPSQGQVTIGSVIRFTEAKNIVQTIMTAIRICKQRNDVSFIFVGNGEYYGICLQLVMTHHLQDRISLPGWQNNTAEWLSKFDVFILYSIFEGLPMSIIEAMHSGLPIIGSDLPGIAELVDSSNGWLIASKQSEALEAELHKIIDAKAAYEIMGQNSRNKINEICSYDVFITKYKKLYSGDY